MYFVENSENEFPDRSADMDDVWFIMWINYIKKNKNPNNVIEYLVEIMWWRKGYHEKIVH